jgi:archaemetzincin
VRRFALALAVAGTSALAGIAWAGRAKEEPKRADPQARAHASPTPPARRTASAPPAASATREAPAPRTRPTRSVTEEKADPDAYPPMPETQPGDWLGWHPEPGQTFEEFRGSRRRRVTEERRTLYVRTLEDTSKMGVPESALLDHLAAYYGLPAKAASGDAPPEFTTRVRGVTQVLTRDVLDWLPGQVPSDAYCLLAVTTRDLYGGDSWNFLFGEATLFQRVGVFSFARMDPAFPRPPPDPAARPADVRALVLRRCLKVVTHEVGHMFGMEHCTAGMCLMNGSNSTSEMDRQPIHLCPVCVRKVAFACDLDVVERWRRLEAFYGRAGLAEEKEFAAKRIARLTSR